MTPFLPNPDLFTRVCNSVYPRVVIYTSTPYAGARGKINKIQAAPYRVYASCPGN